MALHNYLLKSEARKPRAQRHYLLIGEELDNARWPPGEVQRHGPNRSGNEAMAVRDLYCQYFSSVGSVPWQIESINAGYQKGNA